MLFGDGEGFGATVRVRVEGEGCVVVEEFVFCAQPNPAQQTTIEVVTRILFSMIVSSEFSHRVTETVNKNKSIAFYVISVSL